MEGMPWRLAVLLFVTGHGVPAVTFSNSGDEYADGPISVPYLACSDEERKAPSSVKFVFPHQGQVLNSMTDLALSRSLLVRMQARRFKLGVDGKILVVVMAADVADIQGYTIETITDKSNFEFFGLAEGDYKLHGVLVDNSGNGRDCWGSDGVRFSIERPDPKNRSEALLAGIRSFSQQGGRMLRQDSKPWLPQPQSHSDFGYVTAIWGNGYVDNVLAWSASLAAVGSTFKRYCMVIPELLAESYLVYLERCCCELLPVEPVHAPWEATRGQWSRYELVLTKLRVFQLGRFGLKKLVLMDADTLVLHNIDELFWNPAPASTLVPDSILGGRGPKMSGGLLVVEPSEEEFQALMDRLSDWAAAAANTSDVLIFIEQELLDLHWRDEDGRLKYHVLPFVYNTCPEMLDTMPFLATEHANKTTLSLPSDNGVKVVHFWNLFNPMFAISKSARQQMQMLARLKHRQLWLWYEIWWEMHQRAMSLTDPGVHAQWKDHCFKMNLHRYGDERANHIVPVIQGGGGSCMHIYGGLAW